MPSMARADPKNTGNSERADIMAFSRLSATAPESRNSFMADSSSIAMSSIDRVGAPFSKSTQPSENLSRSWASSAARSAPGASILLTNMKVGTLYRRNRRHSVSVCPWMPSAPDTTSMA